MTSTPTAHDPLLGGSEPHRFRPDPRGLLLVLGRTQQHHRPRAAVPASPGGGAETDVKRLGSGFLVSEPQGAYALVRVPVTNIGDEAQMFSGSTQKLLDAQGRKFDAGTGAAVMSVPDSESFLKTSTQATASRGCSCSTCRRTWRLPLSS